MEDNPLKARKRNPNQDINNLSAEYRQMEEQFTPYDFRKMMRRSYYPLNNPQLISNVKSASSSGGLSPSRPNTPAGLDRSSMEPLGVEESWHGYQSNGLQSHERTREHHHMMSEKDYTS